MDQLQRQQIRDHLALQFSLSEEQIELMLPSFLTTLRRHLETLEASLAAHDPLHIGRAGHTIKGALLNLGLADCAVLAREIEERGRTLRDDRAAYLRLAGQLRRRLAPLFE